ncbi:hypothetical protein BBF93_14790 [Hyphomonas sp. CACIAM 19H1]|nr:hypothetical protein BBF93_14790 [Hyphomonas sp. CACIAM 19H1]
MIRLQKFRRPLQIDQCAFRVVQHSRKRNKVGADEEFAVSVTVHIRAIPREARIAAKKTRITLRPKLRKVVILEGCKSRPIKLRYQLMITRE